MKQVCQRKILKNEILSLVEEIYEQRIKDSLTEFTQTDEFQLIVKRLVLDMYQTSDKIKIHMFRNIIFNIATKETSNKEKLELDYIISSIEQLSLIDMKILGLFFMILLATIPPVLTDLS